MLFIIGFVIAIGILRVVDERWVADEGNAFAAWEKGKEPAQISAPIVSDPVKPVAYSWSLDNDPESDNI